jgi:hypothetical protein
MSERPDQSDDSERPLQEASSPCGKILPIPRESPPETVQEFASGLSAWSGDLLLAYGPDGDLYYATFAGDGLVRKIVVS